MGKCSMCDQNTVLICNNCNIQFCNKHFDICFICNKCNTQFCRLCAKINKELVITLVIEKKNISISPIPLKPITKEVLCIHCPVCPETEKTEITIH
jgi:hypothetical protein